MDLSTPPLLRACRAVALLIDGQNLPATLAPSALTAARSLGPLAVRRVYGDARSLGAWHDVPGLRVQHAHAGKNVTDMLMTIEAMELAFDGQVDGFALASADRDFAPLAQALRARGFPVLALVGGQAPAEFVESCTAMVRLTAPRTPPAPVPETLESCARTLLGKAPLHPKDFAQALKGKGFAKPADSASWSAWAKATFPGLTVTGQGDDKRLSLPRP